METASPFETARPSANLPEQVGSTQAEVFLEMLREEQNRFLNVIGSARAQLGGEMGQLASLSAIHVRLTRQFFDAQRSILTRRAEIDAEVAQIARTADELAVATVSAARAGVAEAPVDIQRVATSTGESRDVQQADDDPFTRAIDDVFQPSETNGVAAQRQLAALVDDWWTAETCEGKALIDDAHARSAVQQHRAELEVAQILAAAPPADHLLWSGAGSSTPLPPLSSQMVALLDAADSTDIDSFLSTFMNALESTNGPSVEQRVDEQRTNDTAEYVASKAALISLDRAPTNLPPTIQPEEAFRHFWDHGSKSVASKSGWRWLPTRVLLPMTVATSALALAMAWIG